MRINANEVCRLVGSLRSTDKCHINKIKRKERRHPSLTGLVAGQIVALAVEGSALQLAFFQRPLGVGQPRPRLSKQVAQLGRLRLQRVTRLKAHCARCRYVSQKREQTRSCQARTCSASARASDVSDSEA